MDPREAYAYVRVSLREEHPENQKLAILRWAEANGSRVVEWFEDVCQLGCSSLKEKRVQGVLQERTEPERPCQASRRFILDAAKEIEGDKKRGGSKAFQLIILYMNELWCPFMYCGTCSYRGKVFKDSIEDVVKIQLVNHMIREHYDELLMDEMKTEYCQKFGKRPVRNGWPGEK